MRLNFSGSDGDAIREGIRRIGEVVSEQVALYSTLTGQRTPRESEPTRPEPEEEREGARVVPMPGRGERRRRAEGP